MASYSTEDIRNIVLIGHAGAGKTSLAESIMHTTGGTNRLGSVADKTSHLDFMEEEKERGCSIDSSLLTVTAEGCLLNVVDTPGAPDFVGPALAALAGVVSAVAFQPVVDGEVLPRQPLAAVREGSASAVPMLIGTNRDEWKLFGLNDRRARTLDEAALVAALREG